MVSREGNNAQIRLLQDVLVDAKVDADIRLELGQNITFQVKNNGQTLNLSPLFTNMATEGTVLKALDMASLPVNENTVAMTKQLMDAELLLIRIRCSRSGMKVMRSRMRRFWIS